MGIRKSCVLVILFLSCQCLSQTCSPTPGQTSPLPATAFVQNLAHITTGSGFVTRFTIVNLSSSSNTIVFNNISQGGTLIDSNTCTIPGNGTLRLATPEGNRFTGGETHWALVGSQAPVGVNLFFELILPGTTAVANTVGFNDAPGKSSITFPVEFQNTPFHTLGLAVANPNSASNTVTVALQDQSGATLGTRSQTLSAFGQLAADLVLSAASPLNVASLLPAGNFVGSVVVSGTSPISVVGVGDDQNFFFSEAPMSPPAPASGGGANITATLTLRDSASDGTTAIPAGSCASFGVAAPGARSTMVVALSPSSDPTAVGYSNVIWNAWVDANDHVTAQFCKFASFTAALTAPLTFNVRVLNSSQSSANATLQVAAGSKIPNVPHTDQPQCLSVGVSAPSVTGSSTVLLTPVTDPANVGWGNIQWQGFMDVPGHAVGQFCKFGGQVIAATAPLTFNVAVLN